MSKLTAEQKLQLTGDLKALRGSYAAIWQSADALYHTVVAAVLAGDNVSILKRLIQAAEGNQHDIIVKLAKKHSGYKFVDGLPTTKLPASQATKAAEKYAEFVKVGITIKMAWQDDKNASKPEVTAEQAKVKHIEAIKKAFSTVLNDGLDPAEVVALLMSTIVEEEKAAA